MVPQLKTGIYFSKDLHVLIGEKPTSTYCRAGLPSKMFVSEFRMVQRFLISLNWLRFSKMT